MNDGAVNVLLSLVKLLIVKGFITEAELKVIVDQDDDDESFPGSN